MNLMGSCSMIFFDIPHTEARLAAPKDSEVDLAAVVATAGKEQTEYDSD